MVQYNYKRNYTMCNIHYISKLETSWKVNEWSKEFVWIPWTSRSKICPETRFASLTQWQGGKMCKLLGRCLKIRSEEKLWVTRWWWETFGPMLQLFALCQLLLLHLLLFLRTNLTSNICWSFNDMSRISPEIGLSLSNILVSMSVLSLARLDNIHKVKTNFEIQI